MTVNCRSDGQPRATNSDLPAYDIGGQVHKTLAWQTEKRSAPGQRLSATKMADERTVTIKKYANRRLYNTGTSTYVTLEDLAAMVQERREFRRL